MRVCVSAHFGRLHRRCALWLSARMGGAGGAENDDARGSVRGESSSRRRAYATKRRSGSPCFGRRKDDEEPAETWMQYAVHRYRLIGSARHPTEPVTTATVIIVHPAPRYRYTHVTGYMTRSMRALAAFRIIGRRRVRWRWRLTREAELHARFVESWHVADEEADKRRSIRGR